LLTRRSRSRTPAPRESVERVPVQMANIGGSGLRCASVGGEAPSVRNGEGYLGLPRSDGPAPRSGLRRFLGSWAALCTLEPVPGSSDEARQGEWTPPALLFQHGSSRVPGHLAPGCDLERSERRLQNRLTLT